MTGQPVNEELLDISAMEDSESSIAKAADVNAKLEEEDLETTAERVRGLIDDCKRLLIPDLSSVVGAWGLIDSDPVTGDPRQTDLDMVFIITRDAYFVARYEVETDKVTQYQKVLLRNVDKVELGAIDQIFNLNFGGRNSSSSSGGGGGKEESVNLRISYRMPSVEEGAPDAGYYHQFRPIDLRFFNNVAVSATSREERLESLRSVAEAMAVAAEANAAGGGAQEAAEGSASMWVEDGQASHALTIREGKLERRKSKVVEQHPSFFSSSWTGSGGEGSLRSAGAKALSSVTSQISKLNPIGKFRLSRKAQATMAATDNGGGSEGTITSVVFKKLFQAKVCFQKYHWELGNEIWQGRKY